MIIKNSTADKFFEDNGITFFKPSDFACHHCGVLRVDHELLLSANLFRKTVDFPVIVSSGYRCQKYNDSLKNSVKDSQHVLGNAWDIEITKYDSVRQRKAFETAFKIFPGVGIDHDFIHMDNKAGEPRSWVYK